MAKSKVTYRKITMFDEYLKRLVIDKATFTVAGTSFTKKLTIQNDSIADFGNKIYVGDDTIIFNEDGCQDAKALQLINKVRNEAAGFNLEQIPKGELQNNWFDLTEKPEETVIAKVDVKSAYWETALKLGVISQETNKYLHSNFSGKELKKARLKALGSLATRKVTTFYEKGVKVDVQMKEENTRTLYMYICSILDEIMQGAVFNLAGAFYYYWDCVFVSEQYHKEVMQFLHDYEYGSTVELTQLEIIELGTRKYFVTGGNDRLYVSPSDLKQYPIPQEKIWLLNQ
jgi:hypothetical protein